MSIYSIWKDWNFKIFFNRGEEIKYHLESIWSILKGLNFKIFFYHGEEIKHNLKSIYRICKDWISNLFFNHGPGLIIRKYSWGAVWSLQISSTRAQTAPLTRISGVRLPFSGEIWTLNPLIISPEWRNHVPSYLLRGNIKHLEGMNFKIFFNHGEEIK